MQSIRGLRRAIPSTSPRYAFLYCSSRSFTSSIMYCSVKWPPPASDAERPAALRDGNKDQVAEAIGEHQIYRSREEAKATAEEDADGSKTTQSKLGDPSVPEASTERNQRARDLCSSVTAAMAKLPHPAVVITTLDRTYHAQAAAGVPIEAMRHPIARGVTVSSFTSLCIRPRPHIMFNMTLPSTMYEALIACKDFNVHVLTPDKHGARVASVFTRGNRLPSPPVRGSESSTYAFDIDADLGVFVGLKDEGLRHVEIANRDAWHEQYQDAKESGLRVSGSSRDVDPVVEDSEVAESIRQVHHVPCLRSKGIMEVLHCRLARTIHPELPNAGQNVVVIGEVVHVTYPRKPKEELDRAPIALGYAHRKYRSIGGAIHPYETDDVGNEP
ncbi:flavin reductase like domain-containing protein [Xylaria acuta]|nr:flavin reductase like domain-containing protein [Xylaria acuta]